MKNSTGIMVVSLLTLGLSACASMDEDYYSSSSQDGPATKTVVNHAYVARVEEINRQRGNTLVWVNLPTKRITVESTANNDE